MKRLFVLMMIVTIITGTVLVYGLLTTDLRVAGIELVSVSANEAYEKYSEIVQEVNERSFLGVTYVDSVDPGRESDHIFYIYNIRLQNRCLVDAQCVELQIEPLKNDVCCYQESGGQDIAPFQTGDYRVVLMSSDRSNATREIVITYYLWGNPQVKRFVFRK